MITLSILGVVAAITVPSLINNQTEAANRTKVKKAMAVYEKALNQMIIENDIKSDVAQLNDATCSKTKVYFKAIETQDDCRFKTSDRVWWDITDIENPIIMLKDDYRTTDLNTASTGLKALAQSGENKDVFGMTGYIDTNGVLRINDKGVSTVTDTNKPENTQNYLTKLYRFINKENGAEPTYTQAEINCDLDSECIYKTGEFSSPCENGVKKSCTDYTIYDDSDGIQMDFTTYDSQGMKITYGEGCWTDSLTNVLNEGACDGGMVFNTDRDSNWEFDQ